GVDMDDCRNPETGKLMEWAEHALTRFDTFADVSPSGTGVKVFVRGKLPGGKGKKCDPIEIYDRARYFTICGTPANGCPCTVNERSDLLRKFFEAVEKRENEVKEKARKEKTNSKSPRTINTNPTELTDEEIIDLVSRARNADKFRQLWGGDTG